MIAEHGRYRLTICMMAGCHAPVRRWVLGCKGKGLQGKGTRQISLACTQGHLGRYFPASTGQRRRDHCTFGFLQCQAWFALLFEAAHEGVQQSGLTRCQCQSATELGRGGVRVDLRESYPVSQGFAPILRIKR